MAGDRTLKLSLLADTKNLVDGLNKGQKESETFGDKIDSINKKVGLAFAAMGAAATAMALKFTKDAIGAASDMQETISKIGVIFGDSAKEIDKFASTAAKNLGQSKQQALDAAANFAIFGKAAGLSGQALVDFSVDFVALASDLASFNNTTPEDAINAIGAALRGEAEPLRRYGVLLNDDTLKADALELGIYSGTGALTAQQKVLAAQQVILQQTSLAQGDFARTSDGLANSQRQIAASVEDAKAQLGEALLPVMLEISEFVEETLVPNFTSFIAGLTGRGGLTDGLSESQKKAEEWGKRVAKVIDVVVKLKEELVILGGILTTIFVVSKIQAAVVATIALINGLIRAYNALKASAIVAGIASAFALNPLLGVGVTATAAAVLAAANALARQNDTKEVDISTLTGGNTVRPESLPGGFTGSSGTTPTGQTNLATTLSTITSATDGAKTILKDNKIDMGQDTDWSKEFFDAVDTFTDAGKQQTKSLETLSELNADLANKVQSGTFIAPTVAIPSNFDVAAVRRGEEEQPPIIINVNAPSVIDETGFTRAVKLAIQNTQQRGSGGGGFAEIL